MDAPKSSGLNRRRPLLTLLLVGGAVVATIPGLTPWLVYDRAAIVSGEVWRMFTGHWVHFSTAHLFYDVLALAVAGWISETQKLPNFGWLCGLSPWLISAVLLFGEPQMRYFGGLSALATTCICYLALFGLHNHTCWRWICLVALLGICGKIAVEAATGRMIFAIIQEAPVRVAVASHLAGAGAAFLFYACTKFGQPCLATDLFGDSD